MTRSSWLMLGVGLVLVGCGGDTDGDPAPVEDAAEVTDVTEAAAGGGAGPGDDDQDEAGSTDPAEPVDAAGDAEVVDDTLAAPASVTAPIGVVYEATGALNETFGLIQTPDVSVFSNDEVTAYVDAETIIVCPTTAGCTSSRREGLELMGLLGGQLVTDMTAFAASVPVASSTTETIAGRDARCIVPVDDELLQTYCYDLLSGIALRWEVIDEGTPTTVTAIEVFEPTAADLAPQGPVEESDGDGPGMGDLDLGDLDLGDLDVGDFDLGDLNLDDLPGS